MWEAICVISYSTNGDLKHLFTLAIYNLRGSGIGEKLRLGRETMSNDKNCRLISATPGYPYMR